MVVFVGFCGMSFLYGAVVGEARAYHRQWEEQREAIAAILASNPAFRNIEISESNDGGWILLKGHVPSSTDRGRLRRELIRAIGERRTENAMGGVVIE